MTTARLVRACAVTAAALTLVTACTPAGDDVAASTTPEPTATAAPTTEATPAPAATASSTPEDDATAEPAPSDSADANDPGDGVATDDPVATPTATAGAEVARVDVLVTSWGVGASSVTAAAVVDGVVAEDGRCTLTLQRDERRVSAQGAALRSAHSSDCAAGLRIDLSDLESGTWRLTVSYDATGFAGTSAPKTVEIP